MQLRNSSQASRPAHAQLAICTHELISLGLRTRLDGRPFRPALRLSFANAQNFDHWHCGMTASACLSFTIAPDTA